MTFLPRLRFGLLLLLALVAGCTWTNPPPQPRETPFRQQVEAVRRGEAEIIRVEHEHLTDFDLKQLAGVTGLKSLWLSKVTAGPEGLRVVGSLTDLEQLMLGECSVDDQGVDQLLPLTNLQVLNLPNAVFT